MIEFTPLQEKWLQHCRDGHHGRLVWELANNGNGSGRSTFLQELAKAYDARPGADGRYFGVTKDPR